MSQNEHSSEIKIDLDAIDRLAAELDAEAETPIPTKRKRATAKKRVTEPTPAADAPTVETPPAMDEDFKAMIVHGVGQGIDVMRDSMELMEPGDTLRNNVGKCVAKLLERIKPMQAGPVTDITMIVGYLGVWALAGRTWTKKPEDVAINVTPK